MIKRSITEEMIFRKHSLKYQEDCIEAFIHQPVYEIIKNTRMDCVEFMKFMSSPSRSDMYVMAEKYISENNIDFPGKKEYFYFLMTENLSGDGEY